MKHLTKILLPILLLSPIQALAQQETPKSTSTPFVLFDTNSAETEQKAAEAHRAGKAAHKAGDLEKARELLAQAYALSPNWKYAADLGLAELALQRFPEAARHFEFFLTHADKSSVRPEIWQMFLDCFKQATDKSLTLNIEVNEPNAEVFIDGELIGISPIKTPIYAAPGKHVFRARKDGFLEARAKIDSKAGAHSTIHLLLTSATMPPASNETDIPPEAPANTTLNGWFFGFGGASLLSMAGGIVLTFAAYDLGTVVAADEEVLRAAQKRIPDKPDPCTLQEYRLQCDHLNNRRNRRDIYTAAAITGYTLTGIFAFVAIAPSLFSGHWPPWTSPSSAQLYPVISSDHIGIVHQISF